MRSRLSRLLPVASIQTRKQAIRESGNFVEFLCKVGETSETGLCHPAKIDVSDPALQEIPGSRGLPASVYRIVSCRRHIL